MRTLSFSYASLATGAMIATLAACGGSSSTSTGDGQGSSPAPSGSATSTSPTDPSPSVTVKPADPVCGATTKTLCERACACATNGKCVVGYGGGTVTEEHESAHDCENFYALWVCGNAQYAKQYDAACGAAIESAACITTSTKGGALGFPDACHVTK